MREDTLLQFYYEVTSLDGSEEWSKMEKWIPSKWIVISKNCNRILESRSQINKIKD